MSVLDRLDAYGANYQPKANEFPDDATTLPNGAYDFEITGAEMARSTKSGDDIFQLTLRLLPGQMEYRHSYWFTSQRNLNRLGADLLTLGLPAKDWTAVKKILAQVEAKQPVLNGIRFRAVKTSRDGKDNKVYHDLAVQMRLTGDTAAGPSPPPARSAVTPPANDVPF